VENKKLVVSISKADVDPKAFDPITNEDGSVTLKLRYAFESVEGGAVKELTFKRVKAKHLKKLGSQPTFEQLLDIAGSISATMTVDMDKVDAVDALSIAEVVGNFLDRGRETGTSV